MGSKRFYLDKADLIKIGKGAAIVAAGAAVGYLSDVFGAMDPTIVSGVAMILLNAARKWLNDNSTS